MRRFRRLSSLALVLLVLTALSPAAAQDDVSWLLSQINCLRQSVGSPPLTMNVALSVAANRQAVNLANDALTDFHKGLDGSTPMSRAQDAGFIGSVGENVAGGRQVGDAFNWWLNSSVHYENMTNAHWKEIGIGIASGPKGTWYTLVFGATSWEVSDFSPVPCSDFGSLPPAAIVIEISSIATQADTDEVSEAEPEDSDEPLPTPVILGLDEHGYIQHEIQSGETPGTIMLSYGYSWDALPTLMAINNMTEADARNLNVGDIFLVPPLDGIVTPTPAEGVTENVPASDEAEEEGLIILVASDTPVLSDQGLASPTATISERILLSSTPPPTVAATQTPTDSRPQLSTNDRLATESLIPSLVAVGSATPTLRPTETFSPPVSVTPFDAPGPVSSVTSVALAVAATVPPLTTPIEVAPPLPSSSQTPLLAVAAIIGQVAVIGAAVMVGYRWGRRA